MRWKLAVAFAVCAGALALLHGQEATRGIVAGFVVDGTSGAPIAGAIVTLSGGPRPPAPNAPPLPDRVSTASDGGFVFGGLAAGRYDLTVTNTGFADGGYGQLRPDGSRLPLDVTPGAPIAPIRIRLWQFASISGTVVDEANEPVVGVTVRALRSWPYIGRRRLLTEGTAVTDDRGMYRIGALLPGDYTTAVAARISAIPAGLYESSWQSPLANRQLIAILTAGDVAAPAEPTQVRRTAGVVVVETAQSVIQPALSTDGAVMIIPTTFHPATTTPAQAGVVTLGSGERRIGVDVRLLPQPAVRVTGTLAGPDGPARLFPLHLIRNWSEQVAGSALSEVASTITDEQGAFTFFGVPSGQYVVQGKQAPRFGEATPPGATPPAQTLWASEPVTVAGQDARVNVTLRPGLRVSGRLAFDGAAPRPTTQRLQQVPVLIEPVDAANAASLPPGRVDANGAFTSLGVPPGRYFVRVGGPPDRWVLKSVTVDGRDFTEVALEIKDTDVANVVITFTDRISEINGRVKTAEGRPDTDAIVLVFPADPQQWVDFGLNAQRFRVARSDSASSFAVRPLAGDYYVIAVPEASASGWREARILDSLSRRATRVRLGEGETKTIELVTLAIGAAGR